MFVIELSATLKKRCIPWKCNKIKCINCTVEKCISNFWVSNSGLNDENIYIEKLKKQWVNSKILNIDKIYDINNLIAYKNIDGIECYYINENEIADKNSLVIKLLLVIEKDQLDEAINLVNRKLNRIITFPQFISYNKFKIKFHTNKKIKVYSPKFIIHDNKKELNYKPYIEVELKNKVFFEKYFLGKIVVMILIFIIGVVTLFSMNANEINNYDAIKNIIYSIMASVIFTIAIEGISRIVEVSSEKFNIDIGNMSTFLYEQAINDNTPQSLILGGKHELDSLKDPEEEKDSNEEVAEDKLVDPEEEK